MAATVKEKLNCEESIPTTTTTSNEEPISELTSRNRKETFSSKVYSGSSNGHLHLSDCRSRSRESSRSRSNSSLQSYRRSRSPHFHKPTGVAGSSRSPTASISSHTFQDSDSSSPERERCVCVCRKRRKLHRRSNKKRYRSPGSSRSRSSCKHYRTRRNSKRSNHLTEGAFQHRKYLDRCHSYMKVKKVYVGNLPDDITVTELERLLRKYGCINEVKIIHKETNYGFVTFKNANDAAEAVMSAKYDPDLDHFRVNFGGHQHIHKHWSYMDLEVFETDKKQEENEIDFHELLKIVQKDQKSRKQKNECC